MRKGKREGERERGRKGWKQREKLGKHERMEEDGRKEEKSESCKECMWLGSKEIEGFGQQKK